MTVVLLIALSNKLVRLISKAASGEIPPDLLLQVIFFQVPDLLAFLLPIGLFLAALLCYSRFFVDNEIPVMLSCGISWGRLLKSSLILSMLVMVLVGAITCYWSPIIAQYREDKLHDDGPLLLVQTMTPGRFHTLQNDKLVFYVAESSSDRSELKRVFIADEPKENSEDLHRSFLTAETGKVISDPQSGATYLKLIEGRRYHGTPGERDYSVLTFDNYERLIPGKETPAGVYFHRTMPTSMLWNSPSPSNYAELQWRLSLPLAAPLLVLLALPLSRTNPRAGKFSRLFIAVMICIVYFYLLTMSKRWVASQHLAPEIGVWWVHGLLLLAALFLLMHGSGRSVQWYQAIKKRFKA
jgi:lipopolysaccharide export system permease protein